MVNITIKTLLKLFVLLEYIFKYTDKNEPTVGCSPIRFSFEWMGLHNCRPSSYSSVVVKISTCMPIFQEVPISKPITYHSFML